VLTVGHLKALSQKEGALCASDQSNHQGKTKTGSTTESVQPSPVGLEKGIQQQQSIPSLEPVEGNTPVFLLQQQFQFPS
jgi:hypothetical protein